MNADFLLIQKMKRGDEAAFDSFVRKYYDDLLNYCHYHCFDPTYAEDLTQETFIRFFTKLSEFQFLGKTKNYLYTIAGNLCKDYYKKKKDLPAEHEELEQNAAPSPFEAVTEKVMIESALQSLPPQLKEVILLYYFQDLKLSEIAEILQISLSLVKYRLRQAKQHLRQVLEHT